ncbi:MAG: pyrrolo-quinoline quinone, partial [Gammaproteobacteria bacterium]|nr:pyrrolo-quinoline quinone [Gammaproteobacteria bacterium]
MTVQKTFSGPLIVLATLLAACSGGGSNTTPPPPPPPPPSGTHTDVTTYKNDLARTGQNLTESSLTLANVKAATFGLLRKLATDGKVDAQPLYLSALNVGGAAHNVAFVATENATVYAFDTDSGAVLWQKSLLASGEAPSDDRGCTQVTPTIGITATPVIDRGAGAHGIIYLVAMSLASMQGSTVYHQRLHALDVTTGAELSGGPMEIAALYPAAGGGSNTFDPSAYEERSALLLANGTLYTAWTSHCDNAPYTGWV